MEVIASQSITSQAGSVGTVPGAQRPGAAGAFALGDRYGATVATDLC